jgi:CheY-like chemotaxis protein
MAGGEGGESTEDLTNFKNVPSLNILVVEDDVSNAKMLAKMLKKLNHIPTIANDGEEALAKLGRNAFDLIFMDIQMPRMNGFEATQTIRNDPNYIHVSGTPIIALTAHVVSGYRENASKREWTTTFPSQSKLKISKRLSPLILLGGTISSFFNSDWLAREATTYAFCYACGYRKIGLL